MPDLERVIARIAEHIEGRERIVKDEDIVAITAVDLNIPLQGTVIFNPLKDPRDLITVRIKLQRGHHTQGDGGVQVGAEQEQVSTVGAVDLGAVGTLTSQATIQNADQRSAFARQADLIEIRSLFAIQFQHIRCIQAAALQPVGKGLLAIFVIVDADNIVALAELDHHSTTKAFNVKNIVNGVIGRRSRFIAHIDPGQASMCTCNMQFVVRIAGLKDQRLKAGVLDTNCHTQTDDFVLGQTVSAIGGSIAVIADAQDIIAFGHTAGLGTTVDCQ